MHRVYVLTAPVRFTPGEPEVVIPVTLAEPSIPQQGEAVETTQHALAPDGSNWGDEPVRAAALAGLLARYEGDTVEVLLVNEWLPREAARLEAARVAALAAAEAK